jgi:uncharacterized protein
MVKPREILEDSAHLSGGLPAGPWIMVQSWIDLLFAHWPLAPAALRRLVPQPLQLETFDNSAWLGLTPFRVVGLRPRWLPPLPGTASFPELNLRTYVRYRDVRGVYFFTLEAAAPLAVFAARLAYRLPYRRARMRVVEEAGWTNYHSVRRDGGAAFAGRYRSVGPARMAQPGSLEEFLVERYALYTVLRSGRVLRGDIHHGAWRLQPAEARIERNNVAAAHGITLPEKGPLLHYAARQDTLVWPPKRV